MNFLRNNRPKSLVRLFILTLALAALAGAQPAYACMAWIERVENNSGMQLRLLQNDPSWHPVRKSDGRRFMQDEPIEVGPRSSEDFSYFVIPWEDHGRLRIEGPGGAVNAVVGPRRGTQIDHVKFRCGSGDLQDIQLGARGNQFVCSVRFKLVIDDSEARFVNLGPGLESSAGSVLATFSTQLHEWADILRGTRSKKGSTCK